MIAFPKLHALWFPFVSHSTPCAENQFRVEKDKTIKSIETGSLNRGHYAIVSFSCGPCDAIPKMQTGQDKIKMQNGFLGKEF